MFLCDTDTHGAADENEKGGGLSDDEEADGKCISGVFTSLP